MIGTQLQSIRLKNFKAVRDSGEVKLTPLTVFIGNNGSGKSSLIEGLQTYQQILSSGLDTALNRWRGYENIHNPPIQFNGLSSIRREKILPIEFVLRGRTVTDGSFRASLAIGISANGDEILITDEQLNIRNIRILKRDALGEVNYSDHTIKGRPLLSGMSMISPAIVSAYRRDREVSDNATDLILLSLSIAQWQFLTLNPHAMGQPKPQRRTSGDVLLEPDGSNIAEYLLDIRKRDKDAFDGIIETLRYVLPYATDLQPTLASELERSVYLQMTEGKSKIPGWLLSTGTMRLVAILALLRHPEPPPLIVIEEIENGLDPRSIHLIVEELRSAVENATTQVIITTHSPYLLDLLSLSQIVLVERIDGEPRFSRPSDQKELNDWSKTFGPGRLYTMNRLRSEATNENRHDL